MKKHLFLIIAMLMIGVAVAKPPTKQEKQAQKQAEIAAVLDVIKQGRFIIYEPLTNATVSGCRTSIDRIDISDTTDTKLVSFTETDKILKLKYSSSYGILNRIRANSLLFYKKNGYIKIYFYERNSRGVKTAYYTDVVKLID